MGGGGWGGGGGLYFETNGQVIEEWEVDGHWKKSLINLISNCGHKSN
jgi:hypothetical protein